MKASAVRKLKYCLIRFLGLIATFFLIPAGAFLFLAGANGAGYIPMLPHIRKGIISDGTAHPYLVAATLATGMVLLVGGCCFSLLAWSGELDRRHLPPKSKAPE